MEPSCVMERIPKPTLTSESCRQPNTTGLKEWSRQRCRPLLERRGSPESQVCLVHLVPLVDRGHPWLLVNPLARPRRRHPVGRIQVSLAQNIPTRPHHPEGLQLRKRSSRASLHSSPCQRSTARGLRISQRAGATGVRLVARIVDAGDAPKRAGKYITAGTARMDGPLQCFRVGDTGLEPATPAV
jgi:hypothetical protein